jgi:hypothetical protein
MGARLLPEFQLGGGGPGNSRPRGPGLLPPRRPGHRWSSPSALLKDRVSRCIPLGRAYPWKTIRTQAAGGEPVPMLVGGSQCAFVRSSSGMVCAPSLLFVGGARVPKPVDAPSSCTGSAESDRAEGGSRLCRASASDPLHEPKQTVDRNCRPERVARPRERRRSPSPFGRPGGGTRTGQVGLLPSVPCVSPHGDDPQYADAVLRSGQISNQIDARLHDLLLASKSPATKAIRLNEGSGPPGRESRWLG